MWKGVLDTNGGKATCDPLVKEKEFPGPGCIYRCYFSLFCSPLWTDILISDLLIPLNKEKGLEASCFSHLLAAIVVPSR